MLRACWNQPAAYPEGNFFPLSEEEVGFVSPGVDHRLAPGSAYAGKASDGNDPGADIDALAAATAGVAP